MPRFRQIGEMLKLMSNKERIRNIGIVAHIDHGKTTMTDSLLAEAGLLSWQVAGSARALDYLEEEQRRGITIKTANISLLHETEGKRYVINVVDTPGHVDFTGKVTRAMRTTDGVVVVVDAVEEVMAQTETVTRQALDERAKPVLFINKIDRLINELKLSAEEMRSKLARISADFNTLIEIHGEQEFKEKWKVDPGKGTVVFGSALHKWGFTLDMMKQKGMKFSDIIKSYEKGKRQALPKMLPLHTAVLDMTVRNCPNPIKAQEYRIPRIWKGKLDSAMGKAMMNCDDNGPAVMCLTNVQIEPNDGPIATGRLFSGRVKDGDPLYLIGEGRECRVKQVFIYMSSFREVAGQITAGNLAAFSGLDIVRPGETAVDSALKEEAVPFESMRYVSEPVITVGVEPKDPKDLACLNVALERLSIEDPNLAIKIDEKTGEYLLSGMGELHLETSMKFLKDYSGGIDIIVSAPIANYGESVAGKGLIVLTKSPNKQNSFRVQVEHHKEAEGPTGEDKKGSVWAFDEHGNILVDLTRNAKIPVEARDSIISGFQWACKTGPLCEQPVRNVKASLIDSDIQEEPALREPTQIMRGISRAILGSFLTAKPILLEPFYKIELSTPIEWFGKCTNILVSRRGRILKTENRGVITMITGYLPVAEALDLSAEMRFSTSGRVFWQSTFDHYEKVQDKMAAEIIKQIRMRRGLSPEIPKPEKFIDEA
jgi:elongation factor 2